MSLTQLVLDGPLAVLSLVRPGCNRIRFRRIFPPLVTGSRYIAHTIQPAEGEADGFVRVARSISVGMSDDGGLRKLWRSRRWLTCEG